MAAIIVKKTLSGKIFRSFLLVSLIMLVLTASVNTIHMIRLRSVIAESNRTLTKQTSDASSAATTAQITQRLLELAIDKAQLIDDAFFSFQARVQLLADFTTELYSNPAKYRDKPYAPPEKRNDGTLSVQMLYSARVNKASREIQEEAGLIANTAAVLYAANNRSSIMASNYVATESGLMLQADYVAGAKFDEDGNVMPFEAATRPWYIGAKETGKPFFTSVTADVHTGTKTVMCGIPFYKNGEFKGVAGAGIYLDSFDGVVQHASIDKNYTACIVNRKGEILFSSASSGSLGAETENAQLSDNFAWIASSGFSNVTQLTIDGEEYFVSASPMRTVGWSFIVLVPKTKVLEPTRELVSTLKAGGNRALSVADSHLRHAFYSTLAVLCLIIIALILAAKQLAQNLSDPIKRLTEQVEQIEGGNISFSWEKHTDDEVEVLAQGFQDMTERLNRYIADLVSITAEKERISLELNLAAKIQSDMLPKNYPAFPERTDFDLFASMHPAKEVGGDLYDYLLLDDDRLMLIVGDVSGKGVPAALFMGKCKVLLDFYAMLGLPPAEIFRIVNEKLCAGNESELFVTCWLGIFTFSTGTLRFVNAGHPYPVLYHGGAFAFIKEKPNFVLGGMEGLKYKEHSVTLSKGDRLFIYTDGVTEATDSNEELFGDERLLSAMKETKDLSAPDTLKKIRADIDDFVGSAEQFDDITMLQFVWKNT